MASSYAVSIFRGKMYLIGLFLLQVHKVSTAWTPIKQLNLI